MYIRLHTKFDGHFTLSKVFTAGGSSAFLVFCRFTGGLATAPVIVELAVVVVVAAPCDAAVVAVFGLAVGVITGAEPDVVKLAVVWAGLAGTEVVVVVVADAPDGVVAE